MALADDLASLREALGHVSSVLMYGYCGNLKNKTLKSSCWKKFNLEAGLSETIASDLRQMILTVLDEHEIHAYTYDDVLQHEINYLPKDEASQFLAKLEAAPAVVDAKLFRADEDARKLSAFFFRIQFDSEECDYDDLFLYQKTSEGKVVGKTGGIQVFQDEKNQIEAAESRVFFIRPEADFGVWGDHLLIFAHRGFESIAGYFEATEAKADELLDALEKVEDVAFEDFSNFRLGLGGRIRDLRNIASAASRNFGDHLSRESMLSVINEFGLSVPHEDVDGTLKLKKPGDKDERKDLIDLLSGKHVYSAAGRQKLYGNSLKPI